jgi:transposase
LPGVAADAKKKTLIAVEQSRQDVIEARRQWAAEQLELDSERIVFIDETWAKTNMTRTYGRSQRGSRLRAKVPYARWETTTFLGAMRSTGFVAPLCVEGAVNGEIFSGWVEQHLAQTLRPGDVVVMDNLSSHKMRRVVQAIEQVGAEVRYLPPYSPDLNPIEPCWSKIKTALRSAAARTLDALNDTLPAVLNTLTAQEAQGWFRHCGYATA